MGLMTLAGVVVTTLVTLQTPNRPAAPPFSPGEILVAFSAGTATAAAVAAAGARGQEPGRDVAARIDAISTQLGVPLEARRLGSGGTVLIAVRQRELAETIASRLRDAPGVAGAARADAVSGSPAVRVQLAPGNREAAALGPKSSAAARAATVRELSARFTRRAGFPVEAVARPSGDLLVSADLRQVTLNTIERLKTNVPDVADAQPNFAYRLRSGLSH